MERESQEATNRFFSYFETLLTEFHWCSGSSATGGKHHELWHIPHRRRSFELPLSQYKACQGEVAIWFKNLLSIEGETVTGIKCWRNQEGITHCEGTRKDIRRLVVSLPIFLMLDLGEFKSNPPDWVFPGTLTPLTKVLVKKEGLEYDLVGFGLHSPQAGHFITQYSSSDHSEIYHYDGMKNGGCAVRVEGGMFTGHISGNSQAFPDGYHIATAIYHLRGGSQAQEVFFARRAKSLATKYNVNVSGEDLSTLPHIFHGGNLLELDPHERFWLRSPLNTKTKEYVTKIVATSTKPKGLVSAPTKSSVQPNPAPRSTGQRDSPESEEDTHPPHHSSQQSAPSDDQSLPDSLFQINCRCGLKGDGNQLYRADEGEAVQCDECRDWSHIACQRDGRASQLGPKDSFICDICDASSLLDQNFYQKQRVSARK